MCRIRAVRIRLPSARSPGRAPLGTTDLSRLILCLLFLRFGLARAAMAVLSALFADIIALEQLGGDDQRILGGVDLPEVHEADFALTVTRTRCSTSGHGPGFCRQERRAAVGLGQADLRGRGALSISAARPHPKLRGRRGGGRTTPGHRAVEERHSHQGQSGFTTTPLRAAALRRGITVLVPTPRLRGGFKKLDPRRIPPDKIEEAASLSRGDRWSEEVALADLPRLDAIVCGSVAVTRAGRRCGKGEGYSDLEFAILRELGHPPVPVATTVHDLQVVASLPRDRTDQPLSVIATPMRAICIKRPNAAPTGIDWTRLSAEQLEEMPILAEVKRRRTSSA